MSEATGSQLISVVAPVFNEDDTIRAFQERLAKALADSDVEAEIIFVNDGSHDKSLEILRELRASDNRIKILNFSRNFGHQLAILAGINHSTGAAVVIIDSDLQDPPELIPEFLDKWREGYDVVYGERIKRSSETVFKKTSARGFYWLIRKLSGQDLPQNVGDFRLIDQKVADVIKEFREYHPYMRGLISWIGMKQTSVKFDREARHAGVTKYRLRKMMPFAVNAIIYFSQVPLRLAGLVGFTIALASFGFGTYALLSHFFFERTVQGWTSLLTAVLFIGGVQLIMIGVLGEYIGRIFDQVKGRPMYIIASKDGFEAEP